MSYLSCKPLHSHQSHYHPTTLPCLPHLLFAEDEKGKVVEGTPSFLHLSYSPFSNPLPHFLSLSLSLLAQPFFSFMIVLSLCAVVYEAEAETQFEYLKQAKSSFCLCKNILLPVLLS